MVLGADEGVGVGEYVMAITSLKSIRVERRWLCCYETGEDEDEGVNFIEVQYIYPVINSTYYFTERCVDGWLELTRCTSG